MLGFLASKIKNYTGNHEWRDAKNYFLTLEIGNVVVSFPDIIMKNYTGGKQNGSQNYSKQQFINSAQFVVWMADHSFPIERQDHNKIIGEKNQDLSAFKLDIFAIQPVDCPN